MFELIAFTALLLTCLGALEGRLRSALSPFFHSHRYNRCKVSGAVLGVDLYVNLERNLAQVVRIAPELTICSEAKDLKTIPSVPICDDALRQ